MGNPKLSTTMTPLPATTSSAAFHPARPRICCRIANRMRRMNSTGPIRTIIHNTVHSVSSTNNACRIVLARNHPIDCEQATFDDNEGGQTAEPTEEDHGKGSKQERAEDVGDKLAVALASGPGRLSNKAFGVSWVGPNPSFSSRGRPLPPGAPTLSEIPEANDEHSETHQNDDAHVLRQPAAPLPSITLRCGRFESRSRSDRQMSAIDPATKGDHVVRRSRQKLRCHSPRRRGIQYAAAYRLITSVSEYWIARLRGG
ncbi:hypothetical protein ACVWZL_008764 [Bradyrhizobium sp. GM2.4]